MNAKEFLKTIRAGHMSVDDIGRGMHKCYKNACELIEDADMLNAHRPARAISLAILALEEVAKIILLADAAAKAAKVPIPWKEIEQSLKVRLHKHKQAIFAAYGSVLFDKLAEKGVQVPKTDIKLPGGIIPLLDYFKQMGFYVDVAGGQFISPSEFGMDNREWADWLIALVKERLKIFEPLHGSEEGSLVVARGSAKIATISSDVSNKEEFEKKVREILNIIQQST